MSSTPSPSTSSRRSASPTARATTTSTSSSHGSSSSVTVVTVTSSSPSAATASSSTVNVESLSSSSGSRSTVRTSTTSQDDTVDNEGPSSSITDTVDDGAPSSSTAPAPAVSRPLRTAPLVPQPAYRFILHFRKGVRGNYKRKSINSIPSTAEWAFESAHSFGVLLGLIRAYSVVHAPLVWPQDDLPDIIPSPSKGARLQAAVTLNEDNFLHIIDNSWRAWTRSGKHSGALQLIIYMAEPVALGAPSSSSNNILHRSTAGRIAEVGRRLNEQENADELGDMERAYHVHYLSKRAMPPPGNSFVLPNNNTSRQAHNLDNAARRVREKRRAEEVEGLDDDEFVPVRVKVDLEITVKMSRQDLAKALGLPSGFNLSSFNFFGRDHAGNQPPNAPEEDIPDRDHMTDDDDNE
ncbi:MAG: hypothetical protein J3R72DRAFT_498592 [Linnemannia gamsii]|nr:MAG: hypothetical protein J3R72DRAFT_498592 [Linnemannia gamsii]